MINANTPAVDETIATHETVYALYDQYKSDHIVAIREASKIQRDLSRAEHEARRIERHLKRIEDFCEKNNIPLGKR